MFPTWDIHVTGLVSVERLTSIISFHVLTSYFSALMALRNGGYVLISMKSEEVRGKSRRMPTDLLGVFDPASLFDYRAERDCVSHHSRWLGRSGEGNQTLARRTAFLHIAKPNYRRSLQARLRCQYQHRRPLLIKQTFWINLWAVCFPTNSFVLALNAWMRLQVMNS